MGLFRHTSVSRTFPCTLVSKSVSWSHFRICNLWSVTVAEIKNQSPFIFKFCFWEDPPHPVNWSPTHSTGPQRLFFTDILVSVAQIKKIKNKVHLFSNFASGRPLPTQSTGSQ